MRYAHLPVRVAFLKEIPTPMARTIDIYTDGACSGNPGVGGWGALLCYGEYEKELSGGHPHTTNNRMEMQAVIEGLQALKRPSKVSIYTDSQYVQKGISEWIHTWKRRKWKTSDNQPVKNVDLWQALEALGRCHDIQWHWVRGHTGHAGNERADELARHGLMLEKAQV